MAKMRKKADFKHVICELLLKLYRNYFKMIDNLMVIVIFFMLCLK